eukprot:scaffold752_cov322-Pavlova_lutheri.AAC.36
MTFSCEKEEHVRWFSKGLIIQRRALTIRKTPPQKAGYFAASMTSSKYTRSVELQTRQIHLIGVTRSYHLLRSRDLPARRQWSR